jgi:hypothetical protein
MSSEQIGLVLSVESGPGGNYVAKQMAAIARAGLQGELVSCSIQHDDWCGIFAGRACDCDPDITIRPIR